MIVMVWLRLGNQNIHSKAKTLKVPCGIFDHRYRAVEQCFHEPIPVLFVPCAHTHGLPVVSPYFIDQWAAVHQEKELCTKQKAGRRRRIARKHGSKRCRLQKLALQFSKSFTGPSSLNLPALTVKVRTGGKSVLLILSSVNVNSSVYCVGSKEITRKKLDTDWW